MRRSDQLFKIMTATKTCIGECLKLPHPQDCLEKYVDSLRADAEWTEPEVAEVEATVRKAISAVRSRELSAAECS